MPFSSKQKQREYQREYQRARRKREPKSESGSEHRISPEVKIAIAVTIFFGLALLGLLSFFELAGPLGEYIKVGFTLSFGWGAAVFPVLLIALGFLLLRGVRYRVNRSQVAGFILLFLALLGILHHAPSFPDTLQAVVTGQGGGYLGYALAQPFAMLAIYWGGWVFLLGLFIIGGLLSLGTFIFRRPDETQEEPEAETEAASEPVLEESGKERGFFGRLLEKINVWRYKKQYASPLAEEVMEPASEPEAVESEALDELASEEAQPVIKPPKIKRQIKIPLDLLSSGKDKPSADDIEATKEKIAKTLANFDISVEMGEIFVGPTITQYTLKPAEGIKLSRITALANDLSLALAAHPLRIEAPIPGKSLVGIEVPNRATAKVKLKDILLSQAFKDRPSNLSLCLGKDVSGRSWVVDLEKMPHLLIAGSTGSGKSVMINSIIVSLMCQNSPDDLKLVLVDPKKVELTMYNEIPYLLTPVITDVKKTINALKWVVGEMERRYILLSERGKRNLAAYNAANKNDSLPYIVFVIDELADLMSMAAFEVEGAIVRLAQMARAVGIHLILATQRPSVNVLTGLIKANVPSRIAFSVPSQIDSRTIIDMAGAEKLLGRGDMLFLSPDLGKPRRLQGAFLEDNEIEQVTNFLRDQGAVEYQDEVVERRQSARAEDGASGFEDDLYDDAKEEVVRAGKASASLLQRRLRIGYARAARLLDILEAEGVIGPADGAKPRDVLVGNSEASFGDEALEPIPEEEAPDNFNDNDPK